MGQVCCSQESAFANQPLIVYVDEKPIDLKRTPVSVYLLANEIRRQQNIPEDTALSIKGHNG
jgi:hypothetical protein